MAQQKREEKHIDTAFRHDLDLMPETLTIDRVCGLLKENFPKADIQKVTEAYQFAVRAHAGQLRKTGQEYIIHPLHVSYLCCLIKLDESAIIAALLHDTVEDTGVSLEEIREEYGEDAMFLVDGLTTIKKVTNRVKANQYDFEPLRKLLIASTKDVRVILIKLADRLHNILTINGLPQERRNSYAIETLKFYSPLADFVGINFFRKKLEDYSFKQIENDIYTQIRDFLDSNTVKKDDAIIPREQYIVDISNEYGALLKDNKIKGYVYGRNKGVYSIYRKIIKKYKHFSIDYMKTINDLIGITILVSSISECYKVLGLIHSKYDHIPSLFDDYIAKPKENGYRAIHTCIEQSTIRIALQIKTYKMEEYNEYGPASHIYYKERERNTASSIPGVLESRLSFLKSLVRWKDEIKNIEDYKVDVFNDQVFVFTPNGDVKELPKNATALDFAYLIHTNVGNSCRGTKVNGSIKPLSYVLHTGDIVEILIDKKRSLPSADWLAFVTTSYAKANIKKALRQHEESLEGIVHGESEDTDPVEEQIGAAPQKEEYFETSAESRRIISEKISDARIVQIKGIDNIDCSIAKCCSPIPGDDIIGHVTKSRGIRIHRVDCSELMSLDYKVLLEAEWLSSNQEFVAGLYIQSSSDDNAFMIKEISRILSDMKIGLETIDVWNNNGFNAKMGIKIVSKNQVENVIKKLKRIQKVSHIQRIHMQ